MKRYRIIPGSRVDLSRWDPNDTSAFAGGKQEAKKTLRAFNDRLEALQELFYAEHKHKLLVVLQAMDTGGKDGTIRHVFQGVNPQGVKVSSFKAPSKEELDHDYLWRIHRRAPCMGEIMIFNRSHYEDVLVVRVHNLVPAEVWKRRYGHINDFERMLTNEGTEILKFYLNIGWEEQKERFQARLENQNKQWKFNLGDLEERKLWTEYMRAYEDMLSKTSTEEAPWYIVPANRKWYRNLVVATLLVETMEGLNLSYPEPEDNLSEIVVE